MIPALDAPLRVALLGSGANRHVHRWARWNADRGHAVLLCSDKAPREDLDWSGIEWAPPRWTLLRNFLTYKLRPSPYANNRDKWRAYARAIRAFGPDVLHAQEALAYGPMLAHFPEYARVLTPWGTDVEQLADEETPEQVKRLVRSAMQGADVIATNGEGLEEHWGALGGVERERFRMFSWGVDLETFSQPSPEEIRALKNRVGIAQDQRFVLSPRLADEVHGVPTLIEWWKEAVQQSVPGIDSRVLVVLRAGASAEEWHALSRSIQSVPSIIPIAQSLAAREMATLYGAAEATVSLAPRDLLAMTILETLASGGLLIAPNVTAYRSAVNRWNEGFQPPADPRQWPIIGDWDEPLAFQPAQPHERGWGLLLDEPASQGSFLEALRVALTMPEELRRRVVHLNRQHTERFQDFRRCMDQMHMAYIWCSYQHKSRQRAKA